LKPSTEVCPHNPADPAQAKFSPDEHELLASVTPNGYRSAKRIYYTAAIGAAVAGAIEIVYGQVAIGVGTEFVMGGFIDAALVMKRHERAARVVQGLFALGQSARNSRQS